MDKIQKFLLKLRKKERKIILRILEDLHGLRLEHYDVKALKGYQGLFRLRKRGIRIIFAKTKDPGVLIDIVYRKDAYK